MRETPKSRPFLVPSAAHEFIQCTLSTVFVAIYSQSIRMSRKNRDTEFASGASHKGRAMSNGLPIIYLARHGETAWSLTGQHTGLTDLPLTERGEKNARALGERLNGLRFMKVFTSPLRRARRTCELAGFGAIAEVDGNLVEWNYGEYDGLTTAQIHVARPDWQLFRDGCPGGESPEQVGARADNILSRVRDAGGDVLLFSSGHFLRVLAARWLAQEADDGKYLMLSTASLSALGYESTLSGAVIQLWNDTSHLRASNLTDTGAETRC
jgi:broad specificity phosphatase PhoE